MDNPTFWVLLTLGIFIGVIIGAGVMAMVSAAKHDEILRQFAQRDDWAE